VKDEQVFLQWVNGILWEVDWPPNRTRVREFGS
jgi:hypothetical protein